MSVSESRDARDRWFHGCIHAHSVPSSSSGRSGAVVALAPPDELVRLDLYGTLREKHVRLTPRQLRAMYADVRERTDRALAGLDPAALRAVPEPSRDPSIGPSATSRTFTSAWSSATSPRTRPLPPRPRRARPLRLLPGRARRPMAPRDGRRFGPHPRRDPRVPRRRVARAPRRARTGRIRRRAARPGHLLPPRLRHPPRTLAHRRFHPDSADARLRRPVQASVVGDGDVRRRRVGRFGGGSRRESLARTLAKTTDATTAFDSNGALSGYASIPAGKYALGARRDDPWVFDAERWAHEIDVPAFRIAQRPSQTRISPPSSSPAGTTDDTCGATRGGGGARGSVARNAAKRRDTG